MPNVNSIIGAASCYGLDGRTSRGAEIPLTFPGRPESHPSLLYSRYGVCFVERKTAGLWPWIPTYSRPNFDFASAFPQCLLGMLGTT